jgi:hypothetical protein
MGEDKGSRLKTKAHDLGSKSPKNGRRSTREVGKDSRKESCLTVLARMPSPGFYFSVGRLLNTVVPFCS